MSKEPLSADDICKVRKAVIAVKEVHELRGTMREAREAKNGPLADLCARRIKELGFVP